MIESTTSPTVRPDQFACRGCNNFHEFEGEMHCINLRSFYGPVPKPAPCFEFHESFLEALKNHNSIVRQYGEDSPERRRTMMILMEVAPPHIVDEIHELACGMGLMLKPDGCLDDGTPMFSLETIAAHLGVSQDEAEQSLQEVLTERESLGLSNDAVITDWQQIHPIN